MVDEKTAEIFVKTAHRAGAPREQIERFISFGYTPLPWQWVFHGYARLADEKGGPTKIGVGGARGPGKSHAVFSQMSLDDCQRVNRLKGLFLRQTGKAARESFEDLIDRVLRGRVAFNYNRTSGILSFEKTGSRLLLGGFEDEGDIDKYIGIEYDLMGIEESNQLTGIKKEKLLGSLRTSKPDWRPRVYESFNPGGIGHEDTKKAFVVPFKTRNETKTRFVPSNYKDNPFLNEEYIDYLEGLGGSLGKAWREGDWDSFEGMFFTEWSWDRHVVEPFQIPNSWTKLRSIDPSGRSGITSCNWFALDHDKRVYAYREYYSTGRDADQHADEIRRLSEGETYPYTTIDTAAFSKLGLPETTVEIYERHGVTGLIPSMKKRVMGWNVFHQYLRWTEESEPLLKIFSNCVNLIRTIPLAKHDDRHPEDIDTRGEDHALDSTRYLLQTLREQHTPKPLTVVERHIKELQEREHQLNFNYSRQ